VAGYKERQILMDHVELYTRSRRESLETAIRYLNDVWLKMPERLHNLELRCVDGDYGYYDDAGKCRRVLSVDEIIEEAEGYRLAGWRRAYFKQIDGGIQCSVCGAKFERASQHLAPCIGRTTQC
jgi:hypothetical protein